jgi:hypothetical protein
MVMTAAGWRKYLRLYEWDHVGCQVKSKGLSEPVRGRLVGNCSGCHKTVLVFIWAGSGWIDAQLNSIVLEED